MTPVCHSWLFELGIWEASGNFWEAGRVKREGRGTSAIYHADAAWRIDGEMEVLGDAPLRFRNVYHVQPPRVPGEPIPWRSENPALGELEGVFAMTDDAILSLFQCADGALGGSETLTRLAADRYRATGIFVSAGKVASTWSMELVRRG